MDITRWSIPKSYWLYSLQPKMKKLYTVTSIQIQSVHSEGDQPWDFFGGNDAEAETLLWPPHAKSWLIGKDSDAGRDWGQEEKGTTEDEMRMASRTWWTRVWVNSGGWWWTGRPGVLQFMGSQRVGHDWVTELNWTDTVSKNKTGSWLWLRSWTPYYQNQS